MQKLMTLSEINDALAELDARAARRRLTLEERDRYSRLCQWYNTQLAKVDRDVALCHEYRAGRGA